MSEIITMKNKKVTMSVQVHRDIHDQLDKLAQAQCNSKAGIIKKFIQEGLKSR